MAKTKTRRPVVVQSPNSGPFERDGHTLEVSIFKLDGESEWTLEVIDKNGNSTVWNEPFITDDVAWKVFLRTVEEEGIAVLVEPIERKPLN